MKIAHNPYNHIEHDVEPREMLTYFGAIFGSIAANIDDDEMRRHVLETFADLQHMMTLALGGELVEGISTEQAIGKQLKEITSYVDGLRPVYDIARKAKNAENN